MIPTRIPDTTTSINARVTNHRCRLGVSRPEFRRRALSRPSNCLSDRARVWMGAMMAKDSQFFPNTGLPIALIPHLRRLGRNAGSSRLRDSRDRVLCGRHHKLLLGIAMSLLVSWPAIVSADPITLILDARRVAASAGPVGLLERRAEDFLTVTAASSGVSATATAISTISDLHHLTGTGLTSVESVAAADFFAGAGASFVAAFTLDAPHDYRFRGSWTAASGGSGSASLSFFDPSFGLGGRFFTQIFNERPGVFENSRRLPSGTYFFEVATGVSANPFSAPTRLSSSYDFTFDLQAAPTPEPASMFLVGSGLVALAGVMRRRIRLNHP